MIRPIATTNSGRDVTASAATEVTWSNQLSFRSAATAPSTTPRTAPITPVTRTTTAEDGVRGVARQDLGGQEDDRGDHEQRDDADGRPAANQVQDRVRVPAGDGRRGRNGGRRHGVLRPRRGGRRAGHTSRRWTPPQRHGRAFGEINAHLPAQPGRVLSVLAVASADTAGWRSTGHALTPIFAP